MDNPDMITDIYLEVGVHGEVIEVYFDSECGVVVRTVGVVETGDGGDVEINHVLLHLLRQVVTVPGPVPGQPQLRLRALSSIYQRGTLSLVQIQIYWALIGGNLLCWCRKDTAQAR